MCSSDLKEFEKWAVLTYTNNRAIINEKKGADAGIDGTAFFKVGKKDNAKIIFQVKSGGVMGDQFREDELAGVHPPLLRRAAAGRSPLFRPFAVQIVPAESPATWLEQRDL